MQKKILLTAALFILFSGVVSASSINGDYKGNPIVLVKSDGKLLETDEVPAMIYDGHTVVPISLLRQLGASVQWDQETYSVNVNIPKTVGPSDSQEYRNLSKLTEILRGVYSFEEQYALISIIAMGIVPNVSSAENIKSLNNTLDKVNTDSLDKWVDQFNALGMNKNDADTLSSAVGYLILAKEDLKKLDSAKGTENISKSKSLFNQVAQKYDAYARDAIKLK